MRANRAIDIPDRDRALQNGLNGPTDIKALSFAADEDRYRREIARHIARRLGRDDPRGLCCGRSVSRPHDIKPSPNIDSAKIAPYSNNGK